MTIHECHIDFLSKLQEQSSNVYQHLSTEEIDWILYQHQYRFIREVMDAKNPKHEGFEWTQKRYDEIESLMTEASLDAFVKDSRNMFSYLPADYFRLVNHGAIVCDCCNSSSDVVENKVTRYSVVGFEYLAYTRYQINVNLDAAEINYDSLLHFPSGVSAELSFMLVKDVLDFFATEEVNGNKISVYWETFGSIYHPNSFIVVFTTTGNLLLDGLRITTLINDVETETSIDVDQINNQISTTTSTTNEVDIRLVSSQVIKRANKNPFMRTNKTSPLSTIERGRIILNHEGLFSIYGLVINYIRVPRMVSLSLGIGFEIGTSGNKDDIHRRIIDMAVETTAAQIRAGNFQLIQVSNNKSD